MTFLREAYFVKYLESIAIGVNFKDSTINATEMAEASLSIIDLVTSGVTSLEENPVPPVVIIKSTLTTSDQFTSVSSNKLKLILKTWRFKLYNETNNQIQYKNKSLSQTNLDLE